MPKPSRVLCHEGKPLAKAQRRKGKRKRKRKRWVEDGRRGEGKQPSASADGY